VAASQVLNERVTADHVRGSSIRSQSSHWSQSRCESAVVVLDPIVRVLAGVVQRFGEQLIDDAQQRCSQIGCDVFWTSMSLQHRGGERCGCSDVAAFRHEHVNHLAVLIDRAVHVSPDTGDLT
jgi:hypothetical protein